VDLGSSILDRIGKTPLVPLARLGRDLPVPILAKCEHLNPGGSVKDRLALAIVDDAERRGVLAKGATLIEATAGNTGLGLAMVAAVRGYRLVCVMPEKMSQDKRDALRAAGAEVIITKNAPVTDPENFQNVARRLAAERGWFLTDQFENPANPRVHEETTGPEILAQAGGAIGAFVAGAGTGGTITGVGRFLRRHAPRARVVLADPVGSALAHWVRTGELGPDGSYAVEGIGSAKPPRVLDRSVIDEAEEIADEESFTTTARLWKEEGLYVGGSAGTAVAAALRVASRADGTGRRLGLRPDEPDYAPGPVVVLLPDAWDRYRSKPWALALAGH
jgi:cysteine synthase